MDNIYNLTVNDSLKFDCNKDSIKELDIIKTPQGYHLLWNNITYQIKLIGTDYINKTLHLQINGSSYKISIKDPYDRLIKKLGLTVQSTQQQNAVKAPMPGLVKDIMVNKGQSVNQGDNLLVLEAMKMENLIKAPGNGIVTNIHINKGNTVDKGQLLIEVD